MSLFDLTGTVAVVTGGARGIGAAIVRLLEQAGARVAVVDLETGCDVTDEAAVTEAMARVARDFGAVDILVNNAGRAIRKAATEVTRDDWHAVLA